MPADRHQAIDPMLGAYLIAKMGSERREQARILLFGEHRGLIGENVVGHGTARSVDLPVARILSEARLLGARAIILAHNHPSSLLRPSRADLAVTAALDRRAAAAGIVLRAHVLVTCRGYLRVPSDACAPTDLMRLHDSAPDDDDAAIAKHLDGLKSMLRRIGVHRATDDWPAVASAESLARARWARALLRLRRRRAQFLSPGMIGEPAWDMLLELYANMVEGRRVPLSSLRTVVDEPAAHTQRWLVILESHRLIGPIDPDTTRQRNFVRLTREGYAAIDRFLETAMTELAVS